MKLGRRMLNSIGIIMAVNIPLGRRKKCRPANQRFFSCLGPAKFAAFRAKIRPLHLLDEWSSQKESNNSNGWKHPLNEDTRGRRVEQAESFTRNLYEIPVWLREQYFKISVISCYKYHSVTKTTVNTTKEGKNAPRRIFLTSLIVNP